jgi:hypothetical protein
LAEAFFAADQGSVGVDGLGALDRIETSDIHALNRTMRARSAHTSWAAITGVRLPWLGRIDPALDLIEDDDTRWEAAGGQRLVADALAAVVGPSRNVAVATKMLHLKRPRLFTMLDKLVVEMLGGGISQDAAADVRAEQAAALVAHLRAEGRANLRALRTIHAQLARRGAPHSLVRILDAVLWFAHPAARVSGVARVLECRVADA